MNKEHVLKIIEASPTSQTTVDAYRWREASVSAYQAAHQATVHLTRIFDIYKPVLAQQNQMIEIMRPMLTTERDYAGYDYLVTAQAGAETYATWIANSLVVLNNLINTGTVPASFAATQELSPPMPEPDEPATPEGEAAFNWLADQLAQAEAKRKEREE